MPAPPLSHDARPSRRIFKRAVPREIHNSARSTQGRFRRRLLLRAISGLFSVARRRGTLLFSIGYRAEGSDVGSGRGSQSAAAKFIAQNEPQLRNRSLSSPVGPYLAASARSAWPPFPEGPEWHSQLGRRIQSASNIVASTSRKRCILSFFAGVRFAVAFRRLPP